MSVSSSSRVDNGSKIDYDLIIIGGGVVGLSILRAATLHGYTCACVEQETDLVHWASGSNSGIACTGVDAAPGSLERALIRDALSHLRWFARDMNVPMRPCGSLVLGQWQHEPNDADGNESQEDKVTLDQRLHHVLAESHDAGDTHAVLWTPEQVLEREPNLHPDTMANGQGAVYIPGEIVLEPWLFPIAMAVQARENGAHIYTNFPVDIAASSFDGTRWTIQRKPPIIMRS